MSQSSEIDPEDLQAFKDDMGPLESVDDSIIGMFDGLTSPEGIKGHVIYWARRHCGLEFEERDLSPLSRKKLEDLAWESTYLHYLKGQPEENARLTDSRGWPFSSKKKKEKVEERKREEGTVQDLEWINGELKKLDRRIEAFSNDVIHELQNSWEESHGKGRIGLKIIHREVIKVPCKYCGTLVDPIRKEKCPNCGGNPI